MKVLTCVTRNHCAIRPFGGWTGRRRQRGGGVSAVCTVSETAEGAEIVWDHVMEDLEILATSHGHRVNLRKVIETEILNYEQGLPTPERQQRPSGRKAAPAPKSLDVKVTAALRDTRPGEEAPARKRQSKYIGRRISRKLFGLRVGLGRGRRGSSLRRQVSTTK